MYNPRFAVWAVGGGAVDQRRISLARDALFHLCMALAKIDYDYLCEYPDQPMLYGAGLKYFDDSHEVCSQDECHLQEDDWADIFTCRQNGYLDCEDAVSWRIAELWRRGINALPLPMLEDTKGGQLWHMLVLWPDGRIEDPSAILGMRTNKDYDMENAKIPQIVVARSLPSQIPASPYAQPRALPPIRQLPPYLRHMRKAA